MRTFNKVILAASLVAPMFAMTGVAHADSIVPQLQYPSVFWPDRDNARQNDAYAYDVRDSARVNTVASAHRHHDRNSRRVVDRANRD